MCEIARFGVGEFSDARVSMFRRYVDFVGVAGKVRNKRDRRFIFKDDTSTVLLFGVDDVPEEHPTRFL